MSLYKKVRLLVSRKAREQQWAEDSHAVDTIVKIDGVSVAVGKFTYGVGNIDLAHHRGAPPLTIGRFCSIAGNVRIFTGAYHRSDWITTYPFGTKHPEVFGDTPPQGFPHSKGGVTIGNDVWIGNSATLMSGITVGDGAVIAANAHVINDVAPYEIVGGNPARHIKYRFSKEIVEELLRLKWWHLDDELIASIQRQLTVPASESAIELLLEQVARAKSR
jgi:acetyltransferase-like isoleucine patch superfamily enzyme